MKSRYPLFGLAVGIAFCALMTAPCAMAGVDRPEAQAKESGPVSTQVPILTQPYDSNLPKFVVAVEPFDYSASGQTSGGGEPIQNENIGKGISAQLVTALTKAGNVSVADRASVKDAGDGTFTTKIQQGEVGPFIVKGTVTEFNETADASKKERGGSLGRAGAIAGIAGAITGNRDLTYAGAGVAAADPTLKKGKMKRTGAVGLDIQLVDGRTGRLVGSYQCSGSFTSVASESGFSLFGIGGKNEEFAASALGQATRAAMNDALRQLFDGLKTASR